MFEERVVKAPEEEFTHERHILKSAISRPYWSRIYPRSGTSQFVNPIQGTTVEFDLAQNGYISPQMGAESYILFTVSASLTSAGGGSPSAGQALWIEPYGVWYRVDVLLNGSNVNTQGTRRDKLGAVRVLDTAMNQQATQGSMMGVPFQWPNTSAATPVPPFQSANVLQSCNCLYNLSGATATIYRTFIVPLKYFCDGILTDRDSVINLSYMRQVLIQIQFNNPQFYAWASTLNSSAVVSSLAIPSLTFTNILLLVPLCYVDGDEDMSIRSALEGPGLIYNTEVVATNELSYQLGTTSASSNSASILFGSLPPSTRFIEIVPECPQARVAASAAYKTLTCTNAGIQNYVFKLDQTLIPQQAVQSSSTGALRSGILCAQDYQMFLEEVNAKKRCEKNYKDIGGPSVDLFTFSSNIGTLAGQSSYPTSAGSSVAQGNLFTSAWRAVCDVSSVSRDLYSGSRFGRLEFQIVCSGSQCGYDPTAVATSSSYDGLYNTATYGASGTSTNFVVMSYANRILHVTLNGMTELL